MLPFRCVNDTSFVRYMSFFEVVPRFPIVFFLLGLSVTNVSSSDVCCDDNPTKENAVPNEVDGVPGVEGVDSSDWLSVRVSQKNPIFERFMGDPLISFYMS